ncbi:5'-nucleotidase, lipoprotein e(P4) family [Bacteroidota bacterium]
MRRASLLIYAIVFIQLSSCFGQDQIKKKQLEKNPAENEYLVQATLWYQRSAEMRACYYQTFNLAKMVLDDKLMRIRLSKPAAIVFDIDETLLDNSPFETETIRTGKDYSKEFWMEWTAMEKARELPGAVDFVNHARDKGVEVFYISNRYHDELTETINNLKKHGFPNVDTSHVLLRKNESDKTSRRNIVSENHTIVMLVGDNLTDFSQEFANRGEDLGFSLVDEKKFEFGSTFIVLPNPMYGEWVKAINGNRYDLSDEEKDSRRKEMLFGFE